MEREREREINILSPLGFKPTPDLSGPYSGDVAILMIKNKRKQNQ